MNTKQYFMFLILAGILIGCTVGTITYLVVKNTGETLPESLEVEQQQAISRGEIALDMDTFISIYGEEVPVKIRIYDLNGTYSVFIDANGISKLKILKILGGLS